MRWIVTHLGWTETKRSWPILRICPAVYLDLPRQRVKFSLLSGTRKIFSANTLFSPCYSSPLLHMSRFSATVLLAATVAPTDTALPHPNNENYSHIVATAYPYVFLEEIFPTKFRSCVLVASNCEGAELPCCKSCTLWFGRALGRWNSGRIVLLGSHCRVNPLRCKFSRTLCCWLVIGWITHFFKRFWLYYFALYLLLGPVICTQLFLMPVFHDSSANFRSKQGINCSNEVISWWVCYWKAQGSL